MKIKCFVLLSVFFIQKADAQEITNQLYFNLSYFGILGTHPGFKVGIQYPLVTINPQNAAEKLDQVIGSTNLLFYFHRRNQLGAGFTAELGFRNRKSGGLNKEIFLGAGYLRTIFPNRVYDFDGKEGSPGKKMPGKDHFIKIGSIGLGKNVEKNLNGNFWTVKPTVFQMKPFGTGATLNFALDAGYQFR